MDILPADVLKALTSPEVLHALSKNWLDLFIRVTASLAILAGLLWSALHFLKEKTITDKDGEISKKNATIETLEKQIEFLEKNPVSHPQKEVDLTQNRQQVDEDSSQSLGNLNSIEEAIRDALAGTGVMIESGV